MSLVGGNQPLWPTFAKAIALVKIFARRGREGGRRRRRGGGKRGGGRKNTHCDSNCRAGGGEWSLARTDEVDFGRREVVRVGDVGRGKVVHFVVQHHTRFRHHIRTKVRVDRAVGKERGQQFKTYTCAHK